MGLIFRYLHWHSVARQSVVFLACVCKCILPHSHPLPNILFHQNRWKWHTSARGWLSDYVVSARRVVPSIPGSQWLFKHSHLNTLICFSETIRACLTLYTFFFMPILLFFLSVSVSSHVYIWTISFGWAMSTNRVLRCWAPPNSS